jgi:response regulator of citrate/malate metabolism
MVSYTIEQRTFCVKAYFESKSYVIVQRKFEQKFKMLSPGKSVIKKIVDKFENTGSVKDDKIGKVGAKKTKRIKDLIQKVNRQFQKEPNSTIRKAAGELEMSRATVQRILRKDLGFFPYKIQVRYWKVERKSCG